MNTDLFDAVVPGFALHWDLRDLTQAMGNRPVLWTDPNELDESGLFLLAPPSSIVMFWATPRILAIHKTTRTPTNSYAKERGKPEILRVSIS